VALGAGGGAPPRPASDASYDSRFFEPYRTLLPAIPFYAALGNHDYEVEEGKALFDAFTLPRNGPPGLAPESSYWLERAGARMIVHDTNQSPPPWMRSPCPGTSRWPPRPRRSASSSSTTRSLALEGTVDGTEGTPPSLELSLLSTPPR
jgi:hypothetical protein